MLFFTLIESKKRHFWSRDCCSLCNAILV